RNARPTRRHGTGQPRRHTKITTPHHNSASDPAHTNYHAKSRLTPQLEHFSAPDNPNYDLIMRTASPRGMMQPLDVANVIAFLASDAAGAVHGAVYRVDNGKGAG
ncbi:SDR family oxidoreductase, partial [Mycobacterium nebraskense]|uniref:SDR family oxidoreductase n=1 Tax=Mycobacterium nebraskense TaxID=244292 RepID=UPI000AA746F0